MHTEPALPDKPARFDKIVSALTELDALSVSRDDIRALASQDEIRACAEFAEAELSVVKTRLESARHDLKFQECLVSWLESTPFVLQANECSRSHKLLESVMADPERQNAAAAIKDATPFVVRHDWLATMGEDVLHDYAGAIKLPYERCLFEFKVNGRYAIVCALQVDGEDPNAQPFLMVGEKWYAGGPEDCKAGHAFHYLWLQVVAICAVLDAEVATHTVQRAPHALNVKREKAGKLPLYDFHIVDLSKRSRAAAASGHCTGGHKRLHFRRGHWRHFEASKSWVRWCLVGDPELGFIAKEYRL